MFVSYVKNAGNIKLISNIFSKSLIPDFFSFACLIFIVQIWHFFSAKGSSENLHESIYSEVLFCIVIIEYSNI